jgi:hypothetical protein
VDLLSDSSGNGGVGRIETSSAMSQKRGCGMVIGVDESGHVPRDDFVFTRKVVNELYRENGESACEDWLGESGIARGALGDD